MAFPVGMYGCESWTIKKAESWRIDAFELWCWRRLLRVPWTARRSNQSILKEMSPEYSLEGLMLKLKLQYFDHVMQRTDSLKKPLMLGKIEAGEEGDNRGWDGWMASPTWWTWVWTNSGSWWWTWKPGVLQSMGLQSQTWLSDWTELPIIRITWPADNRQLSLNDSSWWKHLLLPPRNYDSVEPKIVTMEVQSPKVGTGSADDTAIPLVPSICLLVVRDMASVMAGGSTSRLHSGRNCPSSTVCSLHLEP